MKTTGRKVKPPEGAGKDHFVSLEMRPRETFVTSAFLSSVAFPVWLWFLAHTALHRLSSWPCQPDGCSTQPCTDKGSSPHMPATHRTEHVVLHVVHTELTPVHRTCPQVPPQLSPNTSLHTPLSQLSPHTPILAEAHSRAQTRNTLCVLGHFSHIQLFVTLWAVAHQAPLSVGFSRQEY